MFDLALRDQPATVESVEQDYEGRFYIAVVLDSDPGRGIGPRGPGHRFFFDPEEIEYLGAGSSPGGRPAAAPILVAGIGNIFMGDDGFGVEVAQRLAARPLPEGVLVADYGIRGYDLAYAMADAYRRVILVDACPRGEIPERST